MNILIGENIKRLRKQKHVTQEVLAEIFNVTPAAVSKWETGETYPDITLLFPLSHYFGVTIDELMGYDYLIIENEMKTAIEEINNAWLVENNWEKAKSLAVTARIKYPNDYEIMIKYLFFITGGQADNDPKVLINNQVDIVRVCDLILNGCSVENYRLEAISYKAKVLYATGNEKSALELLNNFPSFYHTVNQKIEQLYPKNTDKFFKQLTQNLYELTRFAGNKFGKHIVYDKLLLSEQKLSIVDKLYNIYNLIRYDNDLDVLKIFISETMKEVVHRKCFIEFDEVEKEKIEKMISDIKS